MILETQNRSGYKFTNYTISDMLNDFNSGAQSYKIFGKGRIKPNIKFKLKRSAFKIKSKI